MPGILSGTRFGALFQGNGSPKVENSPSPQANFALQVLWIFGGILAVIAPAITRSRKMNEYDRYSRMWNWEEAQQQYQQQYEAAQQNGYYGNQWQDGYQYQWEEMRGSYDINQCKWWQLNCFSYYINENGEPEPAAGWYPSWFSGWAVTAEDREQMLEDGETSGALKFVYVWQLFMFAAIMIYGMIVIRQSRVMTGLVVSMAVFANFSLLSMIILANGSIITDGDYIQNVGGFYGQFSVLMFMTNFWYMLFCTLFSIVFGIRMYSMHKKAKKEESEAGLAAAEPSSEYTTMKETEDNTPATTEDGDYVKVV
mmetsp:Transcript_18638/g.45021  ORF Transcript_18638/g.45021 Transcript_18638/m.45021 type:complete len:311 (-) Transcript_18638:197-1129(-)